MTRKNSDLVRVILRGLILPLLAISVVLFYLSLQKTPMVDEYFTQLISKTILNVISAVTGLVPFSLAEFLAVIILLTLVVSVIKLIAALFRKSGILRAFFRITDILAALVLCFLIFWGFNYRQVGLEQVLGLSPAQPEVSELESMASELASQAGAERKAAGFSDTQLFQLKGNLNTVASSAYDHFSRDYPEFKEPTAKAKPLLTSRLFSYMGISGIFVPFTAEANYNNDQSDLMKASSILHELAHLKGVAREEEANFTAYLASRYTNNQSFRYSGTMLALINTMNRLAKVDMSAYTRVYSSYTKGMHLDLTEHNKYWEQFEGEVRQKAEDVNNQYLKSNGQKAGVGSYEDMVSYLVAFKKKTGSVNLIDYLTYK